MKQCCKNCHFLAKVHIWRNGEERRYSWTPEERSNFSLRHEELSAECTKGIWSTRIDPRLNQRLKDILQKDREGECYFIEIQEGMSFPAASELFTRRSENRQLQRKNRYTKAALWIAAAGILATAFKRVIEKSGLLTP